MIYKGYIGSHFDYLGHSSIKSSLFISMKKIKINLYKLILRLLNNKPKDNLNNGYKLR